MRQIILDTETSGLDYENDRIIEVAGLELIEGVYSGKKFHKYYKPDDLIIKHEAEQIHGLNNTFLSEFPTFDQNIDDFLSFFSDSELIIHNAQFDLSMINSSLKRLGKPKISRELTKCTLEMAKKRFPGSKNNLNALCRRFEISLESRKKHGALTDTFLLLQVYTELLGGKQQILNLSVTGIEEKEIPRKPILKDFPVVRLTELEVSSHREMLKKIKKNIWTH
jgi:DNA polymerase-3 subunit epsilon